jgi:hypothetical protein
MATIDIASPVITAQSWVSAVVLNESLVNVWRFVLAMASSRTVNGPRHVQTPAVSEWTEAELLELGRS